MSFVKAKLLPEPDGPKRPIVRGVSVRRWAASSARRPSGASSPSASIPPGRSVAKTGSDGETVSDSIPRLCGGGADKVGALASARRAPGTIVPRSRNLLSATRLSSLKRLDPGSKRVFLPCQLQVARSRGRLCGHQGHKLFLSLQCL